MKTLNFTLICLLTINSFAVLADTTTTTSTISTVTGSTTASETSNNSLLLENAKKSREAVEKANADKPLQEIRALGAGQNNINTTNLTDQEKQLSEGYLHQGLSNDVLKANCSGDMAAVCNGNEGKHKFMGMDPNMIKALSQAYAMFGAIAGDSLGTISKGEKAIKSETDTAAKSGSNEKIDTKANDYCKFIPTATEGIATAVQVAKTKELSTEEVGNGETVQKDYLLKAAKSHDSRAKMAQIQAAGWWGGAACYATNASLGNFAWDKNLLIKMGAATLLGAFYQSEVSANKEYADKTRKIADQLPNKGDCNPITDNLCYCSQPATENDATYCAKGLHTKTLAATSYRVACTTNTLAIDASCTCEKTNTCLDNYLEIQGDGALQLGLGYSTSPYKSIRSLARGELVGGTINSSSYDATSAIAKKGLRELASKIPLDNSPLTKEQKGLVDAMVSKGVPANVATLMAQNPPSSAATNAAMAKLQGAAAGSLKVAAVSPKGSNNVLDFSGGNGLGVTGRKNEAGGGGADDILAKLKPGANNKATPNSKILEFAQKAENRAKEANQIRKDNSTPLFEIISMRYQTSGRRLLEVDTEGK